MKEKIFGELKIGDDIYVFNSNKDSQKSNNVVDIPEWRNIQRLADIRNMCDHHKGAEPTKENIEELIAGTDKMIKTIF